MSGNTCTEADVIFDLFERDLRVSVLVIIRRNGTTGRIDVLESVLS